MCRRVIDGEDQIHRRNLRGEVVDVGKLIDFWIDENGCIRRRGLLV
jgi:hypothetical protein